MEELASGEFFNDAVIGFAYVLNDANMVHICLLTVKQIQSDEEVFAVITISLSVEAAQHLLSAQTAMSRMFFQELSTALSANIGFWSKGQAGRKINKNK